MLFSRCYQGLRVSNRTGTGPASHRRFVCSFPYLPFPTPAKLIRRLQKHQRANHTLQQSISICKKCYKRGFTATFKGGERGRGGAGILTRGLSNCYKVPPPGTGMDEKYLAGGLKFGPQSMYIWSLISHFLHTFIYFWYVI